MAVPFLTAQLGPDARIAVEVAWGAILGADSDTWTWTDITTDVRIADGIHLRHGRSDEASTMQPASCTLTLENSEGSYSLGGQSPNWPHVRQNTPVRVRVDPADGGGYRILFLGYADSWIPSWNQAASVAQVQLTASGILRRLAQNTSPVLSSLRRRLTTETNVVAYWPLEDGNKATVGLSAVPGWPNMIVTANEVNFAADTSSFDCSLQCPSFKNGTLIGNVADYTDTHEWQARVLAAFPANGDGMTDDKPILVVATDNAALKYIDFRYRTGGDIAIVGLDSSLATVFSFVATGAAVDGQRLRLFLEMAQNGADVDWNIGIQQIATGITLAHNGTLASATLGKAIQVQLCPTGPFDGLVLGHPVVQNEITSTVDDFGELSAFDGETTLARFRRLCDENGIERVEYGDGTGEGASTDTMGTQRPDSLLNLLHTTETVDGGVIYDGQGDNNAAGLTRWGRRAIENQDPLFTIDVGTAELAGVLQPVADDQGRVNRAIVTRQDGATAVYEDTGGPQGTATIGVYDTSLTVPCQDDTAVAHYASWLVHLGTVEGYRHPAVELDLVATPALIPSWLQMNGPGRRIDLANVTDVVTQHPDGTVRLLVEGYEQTITPFTWTATVNCSPYEPWRIGVLAEDTGDTGSDILRLDAADATLAASATAGATSLSVTADAEALWTTNTDDFPFDIEVGGIVVTVTAISGTSSPQTFTVTGVTKDLDADLDVTVHNPTVLGL